MSLSLRVLLLALAASAGLLVFRPAPAPAQVTADPAASRPSLATPAAAPLTASPAAATRPATAPADPLPPTPGAADYSEILDTLAGLSLDDESALLHARLFRAWANADPAAAARALSRAPAGLQSSLTALVADVWAAMDPFSALDWANALPVDRHRFPALLSALQTWSGRSIAEAWTWTTLHLAEDERTELQQQLIDSLARRDAHAAVAHLAQAQTAVVSRPVLLACCDALSRTDPATAVQLLEHFRLFDREPERLLTALLRWDAQDPAAVTAWFGRAQ